MAHKSHNLHLILLLLHLHQLQSVTTLQYDVGVSYEYQYASKVLMTESHPEKSHVAFQVLSTVNVKSIWKNGDSEQLILLNMQPQLLVKPKGKSGLEVHPSLFDSVTSNPVLFALNRGRITHFYASADENLDLLNLKRGIVSLFQLQQVTGDIQEVDVSGECSVYYKTAGQTTTKIKKSCLYNAQMNPIFSHIYEVLGDKLKWDRKVTYHLTADDFIIQTAECEEHFRYSIKTLLSTSATVISKQKISLSTQIQDKTPFQGSTMQDVIDSVSKTLNIQLSLMNLQLSEPQIKPLSQSLSTFVQDNKESLSKKRIATIKSAQDFLRVLNYFRRVSKEEILAVFKDPKNKKILPSLLDIAAAAQTSDAFEAVLDFMPNIKNPDIIERFLLALATVPRPTEKMIQSLKEMIINNLKEPKVEETAILMLGSLIRAHCKMNADNCENKIPTEALRSLSIQLENCKDESCYLTFLRAMRNAAQPSTIPLLIDCVNKGGKISTWALLALKAIPSKYINKDVRKSIMQVYNQVNLRHSSTSRLHAADIVLESEPTEEDIRDIVLGLYEVSEMSTYLFARLKELIKTNYNLRVKLQRALKLRDVNNYDILSQPGISTAFTSILAESGSTNMTYGLHMELAKGGILKHSMFDVNINHDQSSLPFIGFSIFASGLSGIAGEVADDDDGDATAGIELTIMDVALRPYVFFVGQADLMSHVWSGTASEPTNIIMGNFLLHDSHKRIALSNGFLLDLNSRGAASLDVAGALQVSLWNRNCHSDVTTKVGTVVQGTASINSNLIAVSLQFSSAAEGNISFVTDAEFYESPAKMCTQMLQPTFPIKYVIRKTESIPNTKHQLRRTKRRTEAAVGKCFALHPKNDALCGVMLE